MAILQKSGKITFLRASNVGDEFGPAGDNIQAECVVRLSSHLDEAYGLNLHNDDNVAARSVMADLLRDAFRDGTKVTLDVDIHTGNDVKPAAKNGIIKRVALSK